MVTVKDIFKSSLLKYVFCLLAVNYTAPSQLRGQDLKESLHLDLTDGLSQNTISSFAEDEHGRIWIATPLGLHFYDGVNIHRVPNFERNVLHLQMNGESLLAFSTSAISTIDIHSLDIVQFEFPKAYHYGAKFTPAGIALHQPNQDDSLFLDYKLNELPFPPYPEYNHIPTLFSDSVLKVGNDSVVRNSRGVKWMNSSGGQIAHANSATGVQYSRNRSFVCAEDGLYDLKSENGELSVERHFSSFRSQSILVDSRKNLWVGTADQGVFVIHRNLLENEYYNLQPADGYNISCWAVMEFEGQVYALTGIGAKALNSTGESELERLTNQRNITTGLVNPDFVLLGTASEGILKYQGGQLVKSYFNADNTMDNTVMQFFENDNGYVACTKLSFVQLDKGGSFLHSTSYASLGMAGYVMSIAVHPDKYVASTTKGQVHLSKALEVMAKKNLSEGQIISSSALVDETIYCASYGGGLCTEKGDSLLQHPFPDFNLLEIESIDDSTAWVTSTTAAYRMVNETLRKYTSENGFPFLEHSQNGLIKWGSNQLVLCGINGVFFFEDGKVSALEQLPEVCIRSQGKTFFEGQTLNVSAESANLEVLPISILDKNLYSYSYEYAGRTTAVTGPSFVDIPVLLGQSEFKVFVQDKTSGRSQVYKWQISRPTPFWLTIWFKLLAALTIALLIIGLIGLVRFVQTRNALRKAQADQKVNDERLRISAELHDNIGARLTHIISSLDIELYKKKENTAQLKTINAFARDTMSQLRETIWAVSDRTIFFSEFAGRVEQYVVQCNSLSTIEITSEIDEYSDFELNPVQTINLYRIIQEAINNAVKYSQATTIKTLIHENDGEIAIYVEDDGIGFDRSTSPKGTGLNGMTNRAQEANARFKLSSAVDKGTMIELIIPKK